MNHTDNEVERARCKVGRPSKAEPFRSFVVGGSRAADERTGAALGRASAAHKIGGLRGQGAVREQIAAAFKVDLVRRARSSRRGLRQVFAALGAKKTSRLQLAVMDMWFRNSLERNAPQASIVFGKFTPAPPRRRPR